MYSIYIYTTIWNHWDQPLETWTRLTAPRLIAWSSNSPRPHPATRAVSAKTSSSSRPRPARGAGRLWPRGGACSFFCKHHLDAIFRMWPSTMQSLNSSMGGSGFVSNWTSQPAINSTRTAWNPCRLDRTWGRLLQEPVTELPLFVK